jgi:hypothetical protein
MDKLCKCGCIRQLRLDLCSELYKKDMDVMRSQAKLKNTIRATARVIYLDVEPDDRQWIERKYPCQEFRQLERGRI